MPHPFQPDYKAIKERCNIWRNYQDMQDSWDKVTQIIDYFGKNAGLFAEVAGPGGFNDPDMVGGAFDQKEEIGILLLCVCCFFWKVRMLHQGCIKVSCGWL